MSGKHIALVSLLILLVATIIFPECEGTYYTTGGIGLQCANACAEGCTTGTTTLPNGSMATVCYCDITGPQPNCCRVGVLNGLPVKTGDCNAAGCFTSGSCRLFAGINEQEEIVAWRTECIGL